MSLKNLSDYIKGFTNYSRLTTAELIAFANGQHAAEAQPVNANVHEICSPIPKRRYTCGEQLQNEFNGENTLHNVRKRD